MHMKRSAAIGLIGAAAAAASGLPAVAQMPATIRIGAFPAEVAGEVFYAQAQGFFTKANLTADVQLINNGSAIATAIVAGSMDVGLSDLVSVISAHAHGLPLVYVSAGLLWSVKAPTLLPIVLANSPIHVAKDFEGKTVTVNGINNIAQLPFMAWIDNNGGNSKLVKFVELTFPAMLPAMQRGVVDAMVCPEPFITGAVKAGGRIISMDRNPIAPSFLLSGWVASTAWIAKNNALARRFADVMRTAGDWANKNPALAAPILAKVTNLPLSVIESQLRGLFQDRLEPAQMQPVIDAAARYGVIAKAFPAGEIIAKLG